MLPAGGGVMQSMEDSMQGMPMQPGRPLSVCSVSSCGASGPSPAHRTPNGLYSSCGPANSQEELMNDELLMSLSVRELNKRLHGCPREEVSQVSHFFNHPIDPDAPRISIDSFNLPLFLLNDRSGFDSVVDVAFNDRFYHFENQTNSYFKLVRIAISFPHRVRKSMVLEVVISR